VRRLDAAMGLWGRDGAAQDSVPSAKCEGGVKPPHSKALRAFSSFLGAGCGMGDRHAYLLSTPSPDYPITRSQGAR